MQLKETRQEEHVNWACVDKGIKTRTLVVTSENVLAAHTELEFGQTKSDNKARRKGQEIKAAGDALYVVFVFLPVLGMLCP